MGSTKALLVIMKVVERKSGIGIDIRVWDDFAELRLFIIDHSQSRRDSCKR